MPTTLRPLSTGELFDSTFTLYRKHFALFFGVAALPQLLLLMFQLVIIAGSELSLGIAALPLALIGGLIFLLLFLVSTAFAQGASFFAVSAVHLDEPITIGGAYSRMRGRVMEVIGTMFLAGLATMAGFFLLIVPGIIIMLGASLAIPCTLFEQLNPGAAFSRSMKLTQGSRGKVFLIFLLMWAIQMGLSLVVGLPLAVVAEMKIGPGAVAIGLLVLQRLVEFGIGALVAPIATIAFTLLYYDLRVRKEAFDLQHMMSVLGSTDNAQAAQAGGTLSSPS
jgi:hypothetical protein